MSRAAEPTQSHDHPWAVIQHVASEWPGTIAEEAAARGIRLDVRRMDRGDAVPPADSIGGLVVMGGPMGVHDVAAHPHLAHERRLLREAVERGLPVLGVCLGSQLLASALDARVEKGPAPEIGVGEVTLTEDGRADPVLGGSPDPLPVVHWHGDTFHLPAGAAHLAASSRYRNQAFRYGDRVYGLQFHVEVNAALADAWRPLLPPGTALEASRLADIERAGRALFGRFFDRVAEWRSITP